MTLASARPDFTVVCTMNEKLASAKTDDILSQVAKGWPCLHVIAISNLNVFVTAAEISRKSIYLG